MDRSGSLICIPLPQTFTTHCASRRYQSRSKQCEREGRKVKGGLYRRLFNAATPKALWSLSSRRGDTIGGSKAVTWHCQEDRAGFHQNPIAAHPSETVRFGWEMQAAGARHPARPRQRASSTSSVSRPQSEYDRYRGPQDHGSDHSAYAAAEAAFGWAASAFASGARSVGFRSRRWMQIPRRSLHRICIDADINVSAGK